MDENYTETNRKAWNKQTPIHYASDFYDVQSFLQGKSSLNPIEIGLLGDVKDKKILHLQCHFGQDSISLARSGAQVTGVDLSDASILQAKDLADKCGVAVNFIESDVLQLDKVLDEKFDIVFTSYGTVGWLDDLSKWAEIIQHFLGPQGRLVMVDFHPVVWMFDNDFQKIQYRYFKSEPIVEIKKETYTDGELSDETKTVSWNHGLSEIIHSLLESGLKLEHLGEYDYSPYDCFKHGVEDSPGKYRIKHLEDKIPMLYSIIAQKP